MGQPVSDAGYRRGFNEGADARLRGAGLRTNPHSRKDESVAYYSWREGWLHVDAFWGVEARWSVDRLPCVAGQ